MHWISHRGNLDGSKVKENSPDQIKKCLELGFEVEIDVRYENGDFYLGHDRSEYKVDVDFLINPKLWVHCKNAETSVLHSNKHCINYFAIDKDDFTFTSFGWLWVSPSHKKVVPKSICVMPEDPRWSFKPDQIIEFGGICSDNIYHYKEYVTNLRR